MAAPTPVLGRSIRKASIPFAHADYDTYEFIANAGTANQKKYICNDLASANALAATLTA
jgi:hypothetical protein